MPSPFDAIIECTDCGCEITQGRARESWAGYDALLCESCAVARTHCSVCGDDLTVHGDCKACALASLDALMADRHAVDLAVQLGLADAEAA